MNEPDASLLYMAVMTAATVASAGTSIHQAMQKPDDPPPTQEKPLTPDPALGRRRGARSQEAREGPRPSAAQGGSASAGYSDVARTANRGGALGASGGGATAGTSGLV